MLKLKDLLKEDINYMWLKNEGMLDFIENEAVDRFDYSVEERGGDYLYLNDGDDNIFEITVKDTKDVRPIFEVKYTGAPNYEYYNSKLFYAHQLGEMVHQLKPSLFK